MGRFPPPGGEGKPVHVLRVPEEGVHRVVFLGPYAGQIEHWDRGQTFACPGGDVCHQSHRKFRIDWYAYASVGYLDPRTKRYDPWILQITSNLEFRLKGLELRGQVWDLRRAEGRGRQAELLGDCVEIKDPTKLPPPLDIKPPLERLFGRGRVHLGTPNPTPAPLTVDHFQIEVTAPLPKPKTKEELSYEEEVARIRANGHGKQGVRYT